MASGYQVGCVLTLPAKIFPQFLSDLNTNFIQPNNLENVMYYQNIPHLK